MAAVAALHQNVLILGMAFVTAEYAAAAAGAAAVGTTSGPARDRARLLRLEEANPLMDIVTLNQDVDAENCVANRHVKGAFGRRIAAELRDMFVAPFVFHRIFLDYFRFPSVYMRDAYTSFLKSMLPPLVELGLFGVESELVVPNLPELLQTALAGVKFQRPTGVGANTVACFLRFDSLTAADYPLYAVTELISEDKVGGYTNSKEIAQLDKHSPFIRVRLTDDQNEI